MTLCHGEFAVTRSRPAFEKLAIGPVMVFGEAITGGHYLDILRFRKQMFVGRHGAPSYWNLHNLAVLETGYVGAFYRGFYPWGLLQCVKGIPLLFVQNESMYQLQKQAGWTAYNAEKASGFLGGAVQGIFATPLQKIMINVVASQSINQLSALDACRTIIQQNGVPSLFDGLSAMMLRRSLDWGIRWGMASEVKNYMIHQKRARNESDDLAVHEMVMCGVSGGAMSAFTHPIDNILTNSQKPLPPGTKRDLVSVAMRMYSTSGINAFTRGLAIKVVDSAYHMAWVYGVGAIAYSYVHRTIEGSRMMKERVHLQDEHEMTN